jgi:hypothetical protein
VRRGAGPESDPVAGTDADAGRGSVAVRAVAVRVSSTVEFSHGNGITAQPGLAMCLRAVVEADSL